MHDCRLGELWRVSVKSLRGQRLTELPVVDRGVLHDRERMVVDSSGQFLTQRQRARMALIDTRVQDRRRVLSAGGMEPLAVKPAQRHSDLVTVNLNRVVEPVRR